jgi:glutamine synthetase
VTTQTPPDAVIDVDERVRRSAQGAELAQRLADAGVSMVAACWVDNAGITRVKSVPIARLERAAGWGIGMSPVFDVFVVDDSITMSKHIGGPSGDLRLMPDLDRVTPLVPLPGWAFAPADRYTQEGTPFAGCTRSFAKRMVAQAADQGLNVLVAFEIEWAVGSEDGGTFVPACQGPAYGMTRVIELADYSREVVEAIQQQGIGVEQFHPEYAAGQLEISVAPKDPVAAADDSVLIRQTIRAVSQRHGLQVSFAPSVVAGGVGNGGHVHLSLWRNGQNLFAGGPGRYGLTAEGEAFAGGVLAALPALVAVGAPSVASYIRLVPSHWAGAYQCWGKENREAALRLVTGSKGEQDVRANLEVKCFDLAANPYQVIASLLAAGLYGIKSGETLPQEVQGDPVGLPEADLVARGVRRLPQSLEEAIVALEGSDLLREVMGEPMFEAFLAVRRAEIELFAGASPADVVARTRWRW